MTLRSESEISAIREHIDELRDAPWIDGPRRLWPPHLFHCTDIRNVVSILNHGEIMSRSLIKSAGLLPKDIASPDVIVGTNANWQDCVRLYFRPRTPTQYRNEGFRPVYQQEWNSHCPVPVYLLFSALSVLSRSDSRFSDGNLGSASSNVSGDVAFLKQIPFQFVYHDTRFDQSEHQQIIHHRHAEVIVPKRMELDNLRFIVCRSDAEYRTLLHLLPPTILDHWVGKIVVGSNRQLFHRQWTFVEQAEMNSDRVIFKFNPSSRTPGPFNACVEIEEASTGMKYHWRNEAYQCDREITLSISTLQDSSDYVARLYLQDSSDYVARLYLDGNLAFEDRYQDDDLPF